MLPEYSISNSIRFELLQDIHLKEAIACINEEFVQRDPVAVALSLSKEDCLVHDTLTITNALSDQLSIVAMDESNGQLLGCLIAKDFCTPEPANLVELCPKMAPILALVGQLEEEYLKKNKVQKGEIFHGLLAAVRNDASKQGIFTKLYATSLQNAKQRGYRKTLSEAAHPTAFHLFVDKFQHRIVGQVPYRSFLYQGKPVLDSITVLPACFLIEGDL